MKPDGICLLSVPNDATYGFFDFLKKNNYIASDSHINFYNLPALKKLLYRTGFKLQKFQKISPPVTLSNFFQIPISLFLYGKYYTHFLCLLRIMENPDEYWKKLEKIIETNNKISQ
jgi:hypothetical protein